MAVIRAWEQLLPKPKAMAILRGPGPLGPWVRSSPAEGLQSGTRVEKNCPLGKLSKRKHIEVSLRSIYFCEHLSESGSLDYVKNG